MRLQTFILSLLLAVTVFGTATAQTAVGEPHPYVYTFTNARAPWYGDVATFSYTHTAAAAKVDTVVIPGIETTASMIVNRRAPSKSGTSAPTITVVADTMFVSWDSGDTLTVDVVATKRKRY